MDEQAGDTALALRREAPFLVRPSTIEEAWALAERLAKSTLIPKDFQGNAANIMIAMQHGAELGIGPFQAIQCIAVINGRPTIFGDMGLAVVMGSGLLVEMEELSPTEAMAQRMGKCTVTRKGMKPITRQFTDEEVRQAGLHMKPGPWQDYPGRMMQMRARWLCLRDRFADVLKGVMGHEEMLHVGEQNGNVIDIAPDAAADKLAAEMMAGATEPMMAAAEPAPDLPATGEIQTPFALTPEARSAMQAAFDASPGELGKAAVKAAARPGPVPSAPANPQRPVSFTIGATRHDTMGVTQKQLMAIYDLTPKFNKKQGKDKARDLLGSEFGLEHRDDLTEEQAGQYITLLQKGIAAK